ncbi:DISARM system SNF2-like helicase DrmD [Planctomycetota bacterium]
MTSNITQDNTTIPRVGMLTIVRKRRGVINAVREFDGETGRLHLVEIDYKDDQRPESEEVVWELEPARRVLEPSELPPFGSPPMPADDFDSLVRAARWTAISPYLDPDGEGPLDRLPASAPFHGAVEVDDYQLVPLLKALRMPRVNLLIADDVGLGKTIEAGLILSELLIRRRINRVLILTPASLRIQWRDEMWSKFSLPFDVIDRDSTLKLRRTLGIDANPWRCCSRIIASYHYLRQPDVLESFLSACRVPEDSPQLPWDLLIVDEVHNVMPASFGDDSQLCRALRMITPQFEHRLFLTATPHNGHTRSFTGLLEMLDPVRFSRTDELRPAERERIKQVVIRRLKREINEGTDPPRFCTRKPPQAILVDFSPEELALIRAYENFRTTVRSVIAAASKKRRLAGNFAIEILGKRMLSGPMTFLDSWQRCKLGLAEEDAADDQDVVAAGRSAGEDTDDDREAQQRASTAAGVIGSWMKSLAADVTEEIEAIDRAAEGLGVPLEQGITEQDPQADARFSALCTLIDGALRTDSQWRDDERLVVFTEYKTTLDYVLRRLRERYAGSEDRFLCLYGGMKDGEREPIKDAFNDPGASVRVLIGTDAASEGLNLQSTARMLLHYDCPWNPSRLEQRNGRLDRHGQARDVFVHYFASEQDADLKFIAYLIGKVDQIREDLGATGELFDEATHRRLVQGDDVEVVQRALELQIDQVRQSVEVDADSTTGDGEVGLIQELQALSGELDLDPIAGRETLETAMAMDVGRPQLSAADDQDRFEICNPGLPGWKDTIDETIRRQTSSGVLGPVPKLSFSSKPFLTTVGPRTVFRPRVDTLMLHLGHPLVQRATGVLSRRRFPGPNAVTRWTVRYGDVPDGADALICLYAEELAVNELRETFHHWVHTHRLPVRKGQLKTPLPHAPASQLRGTQPCHDEAERKAASDLLGDLEPDLQKFVRQLRRNLTKALTEQLIADGKRAREEEDRRYQSRQGEVSSLIAENTLAKLEREVSQLKQQRRQGLLFESQSDLDKLDRSIEIKQEEIERRRGHYEEIRQQLAHEQERITKFLLPRRYSMQGDAPIFPVAIEIRLPRPQGVAQ